MRGGPFDDMKFPVLTVKDRSIGVEQTMDDLTQGTKLALKNRYFHGLEIVDSDGMYYRVKDAARGETLKHVWKGGFFFNPIVRIRTGDGWRTSTDSA
jgi:hypothetical protein